MKQLAEDVHLLRGWPPNAINVYLVGDVLIDAATRQGERRIMRQIAGRKLTAHALTHAHPDHQGSSHAICERLQIPLWCGQGDVPAMETPGGVFNSQAPSWLNRLQRRFWTGPPHPVARALAEGDEVAGFTVLETPRTLARPRRLLARVRPGPDPRGRAQQHERHDRHPRPARAAGDLHAGPPAQPRVRAQARGVEAAPHLLRPRRPAARPRPARRLRRPAAEVEEPMTESIFLADGPRGSASEHFVPTEHARGPWDPRALHGGRARGADDRRLRAHAARLGDAHRAAWASSSYARSRSPRSRCPCASCGPDGACRSSTESFAAKRSWSAARARCASRRCPPACPPSRPRQRRRWPQRPSRPRRRSRPQRPSRPRHRSRPRHHRSRRSRRAPMRRRARAWTVTCPDPTPAGRCALRSMTPAGRASPLALWRCAG